MKYTVLVNKDNKWKASYLKNMELVETINIYNEKVYLEKETYKAYLELKKYLLQENIIIELASAYKTLSEYSDYHTALSIDIKIIVNKIPLEEDNLLITEYYSKIHKKLGNFGFIVRYPKEKEKLTGHSYEPWHIRYVGKIPARIMQNKNLTLEEYVKDFSCILCVNKPKGLTSFDVVNRISHMYGIKRVGHTGTLDPLAIGVMVVAVGKATKIVELLTAHDKEYIATAELGYETDTYDIAGKIIKEKEIPKIDLEPIIKSFQKTYLQEVPIYSAIKVAGKKLYDYARQNEKVELPKKEVTIKEIELLEKTNNSFKIRTLVTKGCYIRSLIKDIGLSLGTYATMSSLERIKQGNISLEECNTLEEIEQSQAKEYSIEEILSYPIIEVDPSLAFQIKNGVKVENKWNIEDKVLFKTKDKELLGIYQVDKNLLKVWKNFT